MFSHPSASEHGDGHIKSTSRPSAASVRVCVRVCGCPLTGVGAVVFGPVHASILAHLEIEALPAEQPGHYALQLWFYTTETNTQGEEE